MSSISFPPRVHRSIAVQPRSQNFRPSFRDSRNFISWILGTGLVPLSFSSNSLTDWFLSSGLKHEIDSLSLSSSIPTNNNSTALSMKAETPNIKKKQHRRMKSNSKSIDISSLDGGRECAAIGEKIFLKLSFMVTIWLISLTRKKIFLLILGHVLKATAVRTNALCHYSIRLI